MLFRYLPSLLLVTLALQSIAIGQSIAPKKTLIDEGVELHYVEYGKGEPIVFVHGLLDDASTWSLQQQGFANKGFRAIAISRRHNSPNKNSLRPNHSAALEADDLAAFVRTMELKRVHVIGHSYGAYTALFFALNHPELTKTVSLVEPPILPWLNDLPGEQREAGRKHFTKLMKQGVEQAQAALNSGDETAAIKAMIDAIGGTGKYDSLPQFVKEKCRRNILELRAFLASEDRYPNVDRAKVQNLAVPTLILSGGRSVATARFTDPELERLIPTKNRKRVVFKDATHILWIEHPVRFREEILDFIEHPQSAD